MSNKCGLVKPTSGLHYDRFGQFCVSAVFALSHFTAKELSAQMRSHPNKRTNKKDHITILGSSKQIVNLYFRQNHQFPLVVLQYLMPKSMTALQNNPWTLNGSGAESTQDLATLWNQSLRSQNRKAPSSRGFRLGRGLFASDCTCLSKSCKSCWQEFPPTSNYLFLFTFQRAFLATLTSFQVLGARKLAVGVWVDESWCKMVWKCEDWPGSLSSETVWRKFAIIGFPVGGKTRKKTPSDGSVVHENESQTCHARKSGPRLAVDAVSDTISWTVLIQIQPGRPANKVKNTHIRNNCWLKGHQNGQSQPLFTHITKRFNW